ncbi:DUF1572 domain-containing protein [Mariniblastus sp.]|nr:DUF1572 domain-containing protein [Mariniblastus sp.]
MTSSNHTIWLATLRDSLVSYRRAIDATVVQLSDAEFFSRPATEFNSVAVILRHLGGNLRSRWTDFLTTDGEKSDRNRELEFQDWEGDRASLLDYFDSGWRQFESVFELLDDTNVERLIYIRGEAHTIPQALARSLTHIAYHAGQIAIVARMVHDGEWKWLTVAPGASAKFNNDVWGTSASRSVFADDENAE